MDSFRFRDMVVAVLNSPQHAAADLLFVEGWRDACRAVLDRLDGALRTVATADAALCMNARTLAGLAADVSLNKPLTVSMLPEPKRTPAMPPVAPALDHKPAHGGRSDVAGQAIGQRLCPEDVLRTSNSHIEVLPNWMQLNWYRQELTIHGKRYSLSMFGPEGFAAPAGTVLQICEADADVLAVRRVDHEPDKRARWYRAVDAFANSGNEDHVADSFIDQVKDALARGREKGRGGWQTADVAEIHAGLHKSLAAGQPVDVAAYCMFLWSRGDRCQAPTYAPLSAKEVHALSCMQAGAPWTDAALRVLAEIVDIYERLRAKGARPFDPSDLPRAEQDAYWDERVKATAPADQEANHV